MQWSEVRADKTLQNLPYKIELDEWGRIVMSPASNRHGSLQTRIAFHLMSLRRDGSVLTECSIETDKGVKVADVAWISGDFLGRHRGRTPYPQAPEVCVEIRSPGNSDGEMMEKKGLYFSKGAVEFWLCDEEGRMAFFDHAGQIARSELFPAMPDVVQADA